MVVMMMMVRVMMMMTVGMMVRVMVMVMMSGLLHLLCVLKLFELRNQNFQRRSSQQVDQAPTGR